MSKSRIIVCTVVALLLAATALLWWLPARWVLPLLRPALHGMQLQSVSGTLWDGRAGQVLTADGRDLGHVQWRLSRATLLGRMAASIDLVGPVLRWRGDMRRESGDRVAWRHVEVQADLSRLADPRLHALPAQPQGELDLHIEHALLQAGWPMQMQGTWQWRQGALRLRTGNVPIGDLAGQLQAHDGLLRLTWQDDGQGPLHTQGELQGSPLGWRLEASLQARTDDPALTRWLATLGKPDAAGIYRIERHGGLAATLPPEPLAR